MHFFFLSKLNRVSTRLRRRLYFKGYQKNDSRVFAGSFSKMNFKCVSIAIGLVAIVVGVWLEFYLSQVNWIGVKEFDIFKPKSRKILIALNQLMLIWLKLTILFITMFSGGMKMVLWEVFSFTAKKNSCLLKQIQTCTSIKINDSSESWLLWKYCQKSKETVLIFVKDQFLCVPVLWRIFAQYFRRWMWSWICFYGKWCWKFVAASWICV